MRWHITLHYTTLPTTKLHCTHATHLTDGSSPPAVALPSTLLGSCTAAAATHAAPGSAGSCCVQQPGLPQHSPACCRNALSAALSGAFSPRQQCDVLLGTTALHHGPPQPTSADTAARAHDCGSNLGSDWALMCCPTRAGLPQPTHVRTLMIQWRRGSWSITPFTRPTVAPAVRYTCRRTHVARTQCRSVRWVSGVRRTQHTHHQAVPPALAGDKETTLDMLCACCVRSVSVCAHRATRGCAHQTPFKVGWFAALRCCWCCGS